MRIAPTVLHVPIEAGPQISIKRPFEFSKQQKFCLLLEIKRGLPQRQTAFAE
jgi:hypothetical protein